MKKLFVFVVFFVCFHTNADVVQFNDPLHSANEVLADLYKQTKINPSEVKVIIFEFDYIKGLWHIELAPVKEACIDCYPAFYFENKENLILQKVPHG